MLNELEFSMKKIHIAQNMGLDPKNGDVSVKQDNGNAWDTGEYNALGIPVLPNSDKVALSPSDCTPGIRDDTFIPEYIKRFLNSMNHTGKNGVHDEDSRDFDSTQRNRKDLDLITNSATNSATCGNSSKSPIDDEVLLIVTEPNGADELENIEAPEITNFAAVSGLLDSARARSEDVSCGERGKLVGVCRVCGDHATGMYFGALVCVPCKTFFLRYASDGNSFACKANGNCQISTATRTQCKFCRYQKCVQAGMRRRVRPAQVKLNEGQQLCVVCSDIGNGVHFGALTCEGCKKFFRRGLSENGQYVCKSGGKCIINPQTRNSCRYCRYQKCLEAGMCREAIQMGRPSKIPLSGGSKNSVDRNNLLLRPVNRIADSSDKDSSLASFERVRTEDPGMNLQPPKRWLNTVLFDQSFLRWKDGRSLSLSSDDSMIDLENSDELARRQGVSTLLPNSSNADSTPQPDSTVLSPVEMSRLDEHEEPFLPSDELSAPRNVTAKGPPSTLLPNEIKASSGRRTKGLGENVQHLQEKRKRMSLVDCEERSITVPQRLSVQLHSGGKANGKNNLVLDAEQKNMNDAVIGQGVLDSLMMLPLLKENGLNVTKLRKQSTAECTITSRAAGGCSSPSVTSSFSSDAFQKVTEEEAVNSSGNRKMKNGNSILDDSSSKKFDLESLVAKSRSYWLQPCLPDPNILFAGAKHWDVLNSIIPTYDRFLQMSNTINRTLKAEFEEWSRQLTDPVDNQTFLSEWIKHKVIPAYTIASVTYCKSLPGFSSFHCDDQRTIIRLGQSPSRILMAALNWYDADQKNFRNFLSWRDKKVGQLDLFKQKLIEYAEDITSLEVDAIEAALLNVLLILATDYPDLVQTDVISDARWKILSTFRAYTTGKCGTPNNRVESLFSHIPELRRLGLLHHLMMTTRTMTAEEVEYLTSGRTLDSEMVLSCRPSSDS